MLIKKTTIEYEYNENGDIVKSTEVIEEYDNTPYIPYTPPQPWNPSSPYGTTTTTTNNSISFITKDGKLATKVGDNNWKITETVKAGEPPITFTSGYASTELPEEDTIMEKLVKAAADKGESGFTAPFKQEDKKCK